MYRNATAGERDQWTGVGIVREAVRHSLRGADNTRGHGLAAVEDLDMNPLWRDAKPRKCFLHVHHEGIWPAEIDIRLWRKTDLIECRSRQTTGRVKILSGLIARSGPAETNM